MKAKLVAAAAAAARARAPHTLSSFKWDGRRGNHDTRVCGPATYEENGARFNCSFFFNLAKVLNTCSRILLSRIMAEGGTAHWWSQGEREGTWEGGEGEKKMLGARWSLAPAAARLQKMDERCDEATGRQARHLIRGYRNLDWDPESNSRACCARVRLR